MRYVPPYRVTDDNASYVNGNPDAGVIGSRVSGEAFEATMREIVALIDGSDIAPTSSDLQQMLKSVRTQYINYALDTGSANAIQVAYDPAFSALTIGLPLNVKIAATNTGATTITVDSLIGVAVRRANGADLSAGDLQVGEVASLVFDGTNFQISNFLGFTSQTENTNNYLIEIPYIADTSVSANSIVANFSPAISALAAGDMIEVKIANTNTGSVTITVNAIPSKQVRSLSLQQLEAGQIVAGMMATMLYDGTYFQLCNPVKPFEITGIQIMQRFSFQDSNSHSTAVPDYDVEAFRISFVPLQAGNDLRVSLHGLLTSINEVKKHEARAWLQYSTDNGVTWNPPSFPGIHYPTVGSFKANVTHMVHQAGGHDNSQAIDFMFSVVGYLTVPAGPPDAIIFRLMYSTYQSYHSTGDIVTPVVTINGGSIIEVTEYSTA